MNNATKDISSAEKVHSLGWRQGSIFEFHHIKIQAPSDFIFDQQESLLIIATQSCSVVSSNFKANPLIEVIEIRKLKDFYPKSPEAIGKNQRELHLKLLDNLSGYEAVGCDINKRFFFERKHLLEFSPSNTFVLEKSGSKKLASWLGRNYTRIALPNELVIRMKKSLLPAIEKILKTELLNLTPLHENVINIYLDWVPRDDENLSPAFYHLRLFFLCETKESSEALDIQFQEALADFKQDEGKDGIKLDDIKCQMDAETFLGDLNHYERFSEWDYFTDFSEIRLISY